MSATLGTQIVTVVFKKIERLNLEVFHFTRHIELRTSTARCDVSEGVQL